MITLKGYQQRIVDQATDCIFTCLKHPEQSHTLVLKAPTGAGKTVMLAMLLAEVARDAFVIWATPGQGDLEEQSYRALGDFLEGTTISVKRLTETYLGQNSFSLPGTLLVTNWQEIVQTSRNVTGEKSESRSRLVSGREEYPGLLENIRMTGTNKTPVIIVIDESHFGKGNKNQDSAVFNFLKEIDVALGYPAIRIEASATPIVSSVEARLGLPSTLQQIEVNLQDVIDSGMLVKEIRVNAGIKATLTDMTQEERDGTTGESLILRSAWDKILLLREQYKSINSPVKPLLIIQLPNVRGVDERDKKKRELVEDFFADKGITYANGKFAAILSGEDRDKLAMERISNFNSPIEVLLFKQGISLGWDCPRAKVLLGFRDMESEIFKIQTVGRIMRMPERKHYSEIECPDLDVAFIYSNIRMTIHHEVEGAPPVRNTEFIRKFNFPVLPSSHASRAGNYNDLTTDILSATLRNNPQIQAIPNIIKDNPRIVELGHNRPDTSILTDQVVSLAEIHEAHVIDDEEGKIETKMSYSDLESKFEDFLMKACHPYPTKARSWVPLKNFVYGWLRPIFQDYLDKEGTLIAIQQLLLNESLGAEVRLGLEQIVNMAWEIDQVSDSQNIEKSDIYYAPEYLEWSEDQTYRLAKMDNLSKKCLYQDSEGQGCLPTKELSGPENDFLQQIRDWHHEGVLEWWWKNGEAGDGDGNHRFFSIVYTNTDGKIKTTYPDFFIKFNNQTLAILETKEQKMEDGIDRQARRKAIALNNYKPDLEQYAKDIPEDNKVKKIISGVIYLSGSKWKIAGEELAMDRDLTNYLFLP